MLGAVGWEEYVEILDRVVEKALRIAHVKAPPVDPFRIAEALGVQVVWDNRLQERGRYVRLRRRHSHPQTAAMILQRHPRPERRYWSAAHELGEHLVYQVAAGLGAATEEDLGEYRERIANHLAARILLPTRWFAEDGARVDWDLRLLKSRYPTASHEAIARRMLEMSTPVVITVFDQGMLIWRRANRWGRVPLLSSAESLCWQSAHRQGQDQEQWTEGLRIRVWAVHEPGWRREILRTETW
ncbi:MAG TPA: ImmA/IrrE family metallo-endopeptidase [Thermoguttaceae bacterium]|nr:ImmA/IrrE family metallo-endopeptidase [Thermoguttaceae bacterium]